MEIYEKNEYLSKLQEKNNNYNLNVYAKFQPTLSKEHHERKIHNPINRQLLLDKHFRHSRCLFENFQN